MDSIASSASRAVPPALFRRLAGALPTGVSVVTTVNGTGAPAGMTSGAVCGLSCEPPLLLVCMGRSSHTLGAVLDSGMFCVNVLGADAAGLAARFAGKGGADKFQGVAWSPGPAGVPVLGEGTVAHSVCEVVRTAAGGDHTVVIGLVLSGSATDAEAAPLIYHRRIYSAPGRTLP